MRSDSCPALFGVTAARAVAASGVRFGGGI
jgi:hypothetical protein